MTASIPIGPDTTSDPNVLYLPFSVCLVLARDPRLTLHVSVSCFESWAVFAMPGGLTISGLTCFSFFYFCVGSSPCLLLWSWFLILGAGRILDIRIRDRTGVGLFFCWNYVCALGTLWVVFVEIETLDNSTLGLVVLPLL